MCLSSVFLCNCVFACIFQSQEVKALREETAQEENRYHYINSMSEASVCKKITFATVGV